MLPWQQKGVGVMCDAVVRVGVAVTTKGGWCDVVRVDVALATKRGWCDVRCRC